MGLCTLLPLPEIEADGAERLERKQAGSLELIPEDLKNVWSEVSCEREIACPLALKVTRIAEDDTISAILRGN